MHHPLQALVLALALAGCQSAPGLPAPYAPVPQPGAPASMAITPGVPAPAVPAAATGVATAAHGAGGVNAGTDTVQFSFIVHTDGDQRGGMSTSGQLDGKAFSFLGQAAEVTMDAGRVQFDGVGVLEGKPVTFTVEGTDGAFDTFALAFSDGRHIAGQLAHGFVTVGDASP